MIFASFIVSLMQLSAILALFYALLYLLMGKETIEQINRETKNHPSFLCH